MIVRTNGFYNFGDIGPNLICYLDTNRMNVGTQANFDAVVFCPQVTSSYYGGPDKYLVEACPGLPGGKGIVSGAIGSGLNDTTAAIMWVVHRAHPRNFEYRQFCYKEDNLVAALPYINGTSGPAGTRTWQQKPVWNMANKHYGGLDTNLFCGGMNWESSNGTIKFAVIPNVVISNSLNAVYWAAGPSVKLFANNAADTYPSEPVGYTYLFDQNTANELSKGKINLTYFCERKGVFADAFYDNLQLVVPSGPYRVVDSFSFPGFTRGFNYGLGMHMHQGVLYKTNGAGAAAHVVITNSADFKTAGVRIFQEPIDDLWHRDEIEFNIHGCTLNLSNLNGYYLNIVDASYTQIVAIPLGT